MTAYPTISRPCPYKDRLADVMDGDFCRMCRRRVTDLTAMDDAAIDEFLRSCTQGEEVCVSYRRPARLLMGAAVAASLAATPLAAAADGAGDAAPREPPAAAATPSRDPPPQAAHASERFAPTEVGGMVVVFATPGPVDRRDLPQPIEMRPVRRG